MSETRFIYEKAIERYLDIEGKYKEWTYMYAIFVGALFVGYGADSGDSFLSSLIPIIGLLTSLCWFGSFYGYRRWLVSWNKVLRLHEERYLKEVCNNNDLQRLYSLVDEKSVKRLGFSTQSITNLFIRLVIVAWSLILFKKCFDVFCLIAIVISAGFVLFPLIWSPIKNCKWKCWLLSDTDNHYKLNQDKTGEYKVCPPSQRATLPPLETTKQNYP